MPSPSAAATQHPLPELDLHHSVGAGRPRRHRAVAASPLDDKATRRGMGGERVISLCPSRGTRYKCNLIPVALAQNLTMIPALLCRPPLPICCKPDGWCCRSTPTEQAPAAQPPSPSVMTCLGAPRCGDSQHSRHATGRQRRPARDCCAAGPLPAQAPRCCWHWMACAPSQVRYHLRRFAR